MISLKQKKFKVLKTLNTPQKIQTFLVSISFNYEKNGETCMSPIRVLEENKGRK